MVEHHDASSASGLFVGPGISRSIRGFAALFQHLIFVGAASLAATDDVCSAANGSIGKRGFDNEIREKKD